MSYNGKKESPKGGFGKQESLQAIVFADDFLQDLKPSHRIYPSVLLPIVNAPLLDYILETLVRSRVNQVFLYCSNHIDKIKVYLDSLEKTRNENIVITPIYSDGCRSLGDALRDIDTKGCIRGDFILIRSNAFGNVNLQALMDLHKNKKEKDKNTAMTMIFRTLGSSKDSALKNDASLVVSNANTKKLLHYQRFAPNEKKVELELQWFLENDKVHINTALLDTHIYVCSQSVLPLFADNFDFQTMEDFIRGVLINEEFLDSRIYWESLPSSAYALPVTSWKNYKILCRDILQRQCYPLVPDTLPLSLRNYIYMMRSTYKHRSSVLSKGSTIISESIIGDNSSLKENATINKSVIGQNCLVGIKTEINNSYIISGAKIEDGCVINDSIIFSNCSIERGTELKSCILLNNVTCKGKFSNLLLEMSDDGKKLIDKNIEQQLSSSNFSTSHDHNEDCDDDDDDDASSCSSVSSAWSSSSQEDLAQQQVDDFLDDNAIFLREVIESLQRGYQDNVKSENLILEINSSRYAYNVSIRQVSYNVIKAILNIPLNILNPDASSAEYTKSVRTVMVYFKPIINNYVKTEDAQEDCLKAVQDVVCANEEKMIPCVQSVLHYLYDNDILTEEKIIEWYEQDSTERSDYYETESSNELESQIKTVLAIKTAISPFITWLKEAEEDSSSESE